METDVHLATRSNVGRPATGQMLTANPPHHRGGVEGGVEGGQRRDKEFENAKKQLTVTITVRVRSPQ